jgi:hypothetical protein
VSFNYFISEAVFAFILDAVELVARDGWRLLPQYRFDAATGLWRHRAGTPEPPLSLLDIRFQGGAMRYAAHRHREPEGRLAAYLAEARVLLASPPPAPAEAGGADVSSARDEDEDFEHLRWFWLPGEVDAELAAHGGTT